MVMRIERRLRARYVGFPFEKYIGFILAVLPASDLVGIRGIRMVERFSVNDPSDAKLGCYHPGRIARDGIIEIHLPNVLERLAGWETFLFHREIAAYRLSAVLCHEVGHHAHHTWRHGVTKPQEEVFANRYARAGAFAYLKSRSSEILSSHGWASWDVLSYGFNGICYWRKVCRELLEWLDANKNGIEFP